MNELVSGLGNMFSAFVLVACLVMFGIVGLETLLGFNRLAPIRRILSQSRHRWLAVLLPFSPAASAAAVIRSRLQSYLGVWTGILVCGLALSTYFSAIFSGWWLALPRDLGRPMRGWLAILLGSIFWGGGTFAFAAAIARFLD